MPKSACIQVACQRQKYSAKILEIEVTNIFLMKHHDINDTERLPTTRDLLVREELRLIQTCTQAELESCKTVSGV